MNETRFEQIEDYLNGTLAGTALAQFEAQLKADPALQAEVELQRDIDIALMDDNKIPFVQTLRNIYEKESNVVPGEIVDTPPIGRRRILRFAIAAAVAVLLAVFALPILFPTSGTMQLSENTIGSPPDIDIWRSTEGADPMMKNSLGRTKKLSINNTKLLYRVQDKSLILKKNLFK